MLKQIVPYEDYYGACKAEQGRGEKMARTFCTKFSSSFLVVGCGITKKSERDARVPAPNEQFKQRLSKVIWGPKRDPQADNVQRTVV
mmetsp:Transcript_47237/g.84522  ORF Transcript_47237/g.84522 Transcript_47237/m.84522 type:complete len:87 (+) Transcript_47237:202-462(+)